MFYSLDNIRELAAAVKVAKLKWISDGRNKTEIYEIFRQASITYRAACDEFFLGEKL